MSTRPSTALRAPERRDATSREALVRRIIAEYQEMPGLSLTFAQAQRLFGLRAETCARVLETLVQREILRVNAKGVFVRGGGWP